MFLLAAIFLMGAACGTPQDEVVKVSLDLPVDWESVIDMDALGAPSSTPYIGTIRFLYGGTQQRDFPYTGHNASFNADGLDDLMVQALTAGQVIMEGSVSGAGSVPGDVTVSLNKANGFSEAGTLLYPREKHSAVLRDGVVYILGGNPGTRVIEAVASSGESFVSSAYAASLVYPREEAAVLHDTIGDQLFVFRGASAVPVDDDLYEIVDLVNETVTSKQLQNYRTDHFPVIHDQRIILVGGYDSNLRDSWQINSYELDVSQDPYLESILPSIRLDSERQKVLCNVNDLKMVCLGGFGNSTYIDEVKIFNLPTNSAVATTYLSEGRIGAAIANINNQSLVVVGGLGQSGYLSDVIFLDLDSLNITSYENALYYPRAYHTATFLVNSNEVLIIGGGPSVEASHTAELLDLTTGESTLLPWPMKYPRTGHTATLLPDGRVLVTGGISPDREMEVWNPRSGL